MVSKRVSISERRSRERPRGADAFFDEQPAPAPEQSARKQAKVTMYVRYDQPGAVEDIKHAERKRGRRVSLSELYTEALDLLIAKYAGK